MPGGPTSLSSTGKDVGPTALTALQLSFQNSEGNGALLLGFTAGGARIFDVEALYFTVSMISMSFLRISLISWLTSTPLDVAFSLR